MGGPPDPSKGVDPAQRKKGKGTRHLVNKRLCTTVYTRGRRAGERCGWIALDGSEKCKKHQGNRHPTNSVQREEGRANWYARLKRLQASDPGIFARGGHGRPLADFLAHQKMQVAAGLPAAPLIPLKDIPNAPIPKTDDKIVQKADRLLRQELAVQPVLDKPFDKLEPHEQLTVLTGQSLQTLHDIMLFDMRDKEGEIALKVVSLRKDTALRILALRVKIDRNAMAERKLDQTQDLIRRLKAGDGAKVIEG